MVPLTRVHNEGDVHAFSRAHGFPIVLKGLVPQLSHKSDVDLVRLDLLDDAAAASAFRSLAKEVGRLDEGIVVAQRQIQSSLAEVIVGAINDDDFGTHIVVGRGGIWAEASPDRAWAHGVLQIEDAVRLLTRFRFGAALVADARGLQPDVRGLAEVIARFSAWAQSHAASVREVEVNPVIVGKNGVWCVDCLIGMR
jgi:acetate---CoA ligase (ADP-forming)